MFSNLGPAGASRGCASVVECVPVLRPISQQGLVHPPEPGHRHHHILHGGF